MEDRQLYTKKWCASVKRQQSKKGGRGKKAGVEGGEGGECRGGDRCKGVVLGSQGTTHRFEMGSDDM
ncbi:hypothetical protein NQZ68_008902 [Dissostichus eleginoides]|nr:hypothetical protein NQZ68_008902 [Dissostichus eleginoides]